MKKLITTCLSFFWFGFGYSQSTNHGIDANWYQSSKTATVLTGAFSPTNYVHGAVANNMVVKQNGTVILFYKQNGQNKWVQSSNGGNTWSSPGNLPASAIGGLSTISADIDQNDNIYIVWKSGTFSLGFAKFNGSSWSPTYTINTTTQTSSDTISFSQITVDRKGRIHIMWQQGNHQNYNPRIKSTCWYARSTDGGNTFTTTLLSQGNTYHAAFPVADFGGTAHDTLMIAWRENVNGWKFSTSSLPGNPNYPNGWNWDVKARISYDGGASWNPVFTLQGSGANDTDDDQWDPNVIVDKNGVIHAFYHIYHNLALPDYNANIMYEYSLNGGNTWSSPMQLSTTGIRSHLIKTAYDYNNNYVWCTWKDEMDFGNLPNNPQSDLKAVYIQNTGTPVISPQEFITDEDTFEVSYHNFKVGNDGIMRATYNISKMGGKGDTIFYTQRTSLTTGLNHISPKSNINIFPNPTKDFVYILSDNPALTSVKVFNILGEELENIQLQQNAIFLPESGIYLIEVNDGKNIMRFKIIKN
ncbi:MAG: hypothetical protein KatS3mg027_1369 [Bacteroidia bacterium]|nr:MAG: hypothetical protein KatS3mg027_1369 [Bacteroidia bacterium]